MVTGDVIQYFGSMRHAVLSKLKIITKTTCHDTKTIMNIRQFYTACYACKKMALFNINRRCQVKFNVCPKKRLPNTTSDLLSYKAESIGSISAALC